VPETRLYVAMEDIRVQSGFDAAVLTDLDGKLLSAVRSSDILEDTIDILLLVAAQIAARSEDAKAMETSGESEFFDWEGRRIVCRWFEARKPGVLVVLVPKGKSYRWAANRMVKEIQHLIGS
jgi:hypothetical protein